MVLVPKCSLRVVSKVFFKTPDDSRNEGKKGESPPYQAGNLDALIGF
jgi:hypothetical protein